MMPHADTGMPSTADEVFDLLKTAIDSSFLGDFAVAHFGQKTTTI
jgi:hypothetical protein